MNVELLTSREVDRLLRYSPGKATRLARRGLLPYITLPGGDIRFRQRDIEQIIEGDTSTAGAGADRGAGS